MYSLSRRLQLSLIFPIIITVKFVLKIVQLQTANAAMVPNLTVPILSFILEITAAYLLAVMFFSIETLIRTYLTDQDSQQSLQIKSELKSKELFGKIGVLTKWDELDSNNRITRSIIFQAALVLFSIYAITSSNAVIGIGVSLSILLQTLFEQISLLKQNKDISQWMWQIKASVPRDIQVIYVSTVGIVFLALCSALFK
jgi:hypothetical protein